MNQPMNYADAPDQRDFSELIPQGTLAWGVLKITPHNLQQGAWETPSKTSDGRYLRADIIIEGGRWDKRHVFTNLTTYNQNEMAVNIGRGQIKAILEVGRGASPENMNAYALASYADLDGLKVALKVSEEHSAGYNPKNDVAVFLSPIQTVKDWERLMAGDLEPSGIQAIKKPTGAAAAATPTTPARWGGGEQASPVPAPAPNPVPPVAPGEAPSPAAAPSWLNQTPPKTPGSTAGTPTQG
jgi:hypothetical protein